MPEPAPHELIRQAAALIRERANAAKADAAPVPETQWGRLMDGYLGGPLGKHCASWTPEVVLLIADWLDIGANPYACVQLDPMLAVARAYLASEPPPTTLTIPEPHDGTRFEFEHHTDMYAAWRNDKSSTQAGWTGGDGGDVWCLYGSTVPMTWTAMQEKFGRSLLSAVRLTPAAKLCTPTRYPQPQKG